MTFPNKGVYWKLKKEWYEINSDYISLVNQEFKSVLKEHLISYQMDKDQGQLQLEWPENIRKNANSKEKLKESQTEEGKTTSELDGESSQMELEDKQEDEGNNQEETSEKPLEMGGTDEKKPKRNLREAQFNRSYQTVEDYYVCDQICPLGIEICDLIFESRKSQKTYFYHNKEKFGQSTREVRSQILNSAEIIKDANINNSFNILEQFYERATNPQTDSCYREEIKKKFKKRFPTKKDFLNIFQKKIVFVYAFADDAKEMRLLETEADREIFVSKTTLEEAHRYFKGKGDILFQELFDSGFLTKKGSLTTKFFGTSQERFKLQSLSVKNQNQQLYKVLKNHAPDFKSLIAKLELISLSEELKKLGFEFKICQIKRKDYNYEEYDKSIKSFDISENFEPDPSEIRDPEFSDDFIEGLRSQEEFNQEAKEMSSSQKETKGTISSQKAKIKPQFQEGGEFTVEKIVFDINKTVADGACGLHALLGQKNANEVYEFKPENGDAREYFIRKVKEKTQAEFFFKEKWQEIITNTLRDYEGNPGISQRPHLDKIFNQIQIQDKLKDYKRKKARILMRHESYINIKNSLLDEIRDDEKICKQVEGILKTEGLFKETEENILNRINTALKTIIESLSEIELGEKLKENQRCLEQISKEIDKLQKDFGSDENVTDAFFEAYRNKKYYFSKEELEFAALLFNKKMQIYSIDQTRKPVLINLPNENGAEEVVIFYKSQHFSRCSYSQKNLLAHYSSKIILQGSKSKPSQAFSQTVSQLETQPSTQQGKISQPKESPIQGFDPFWSFQGTETTKTSALLNSQSMSMPHTSNKSEIFGPHLKIDEEISDFQNPLSNNSFSINQSLLSFQRGKQKDGIIEVPNSTLNFRNLAPLRNSSLLGKRSLNLEKKPSHFSRKDRNRRMHQPALTNSCSTKEIIEIEDSDEDQEQKVSVSVSVSGSGSESESENEDEYEEESEDEDEYEEENEAEDDNENEDQSEDENVEVILKKIKKNFQI